MPHEYDGYYNGNHTFSFRGCGHLSTTKPRNAPHPPPLSYDHGCRHCDREDAERQAKAAYEYYGPLIDEEQELAKMYERHTMTPKKREVYEYWRQNYDRWRQKRLVALEEVEILKQMLNTADEEAWRDFKKRWGQPRICNEWPT